MLVRRWFTFHTRGLAQRPVASPSFLSTAYSLQPTAHLTASSSGFTLIEALAALLVIAVGVVGVAALYFDNVQATPEDRLHMEAAELAESIGARIRANAAGRVGYAGTIGVLCKRKTKPRTPQEAAAQEAACWEDEVERRLPSGLGSITRDPTTTPPTYVVAVSWSAPARGTASYVMRVEETAD